MSHAKATRALGLALAVAASGLGACTGDTGKGPDSLSGVASNGRVPGSPGTGA